MANFIVLLSGLLFIATTDGQLALRGQPREILGMLVVAVLMIATFIIVTSVVIDVGSSLMLQRESVVNYWWKAFMLYCGESLLTEFSGLFFGLQMAQYSPLTSHRLRETMRQQKDALFEKLLNLEDKLNEKYMSKGGSYFRSSYLMSIIHKREIKKIHQIQELEDREFQAPLAELKKIVTLPEIHSVGSIHQILFNKHADRVNDRDPTLEFKSFALNAMRSLDKSITKSIQPVLLAYLFLAEEGSSAAKNLESVEFAKLMSTKWRTMQKLILQSSRTLTVLTDINEAPIKRWPLLFQPLQDLFFKWNMGFDTFGQFLATMKAKEDKPSFEMLNLMLAAKGRHTRRKKVIGFESSTKEDQRVAREWHEEEQGKMVLKNSSTRRQSLNPFEQEEVDEPEFDNVLFQADTSAAKLKIVSAAKPKWGIIREQLLKQTQAEPTSNEPTSKQILRNTIATAQKEKPVDPKTFEKAGFKIGPDTGRMTNIPASNTWIIEYSAVKSQWQLKHMEERGKDSCVAFLNSTTVLSGCRNMREWQLWDGNPRLLPLRNYNLQNSVLVEVVAPGKPDAKSVRMTGFFSRKSATVPGEATFWQFAPSLNGEYAHLGLIRDNRYVYFNSAAAEAYLAAEAAKEAEIQSARFGHSHSASKASPIVARRVTSNKRFVGQTVAQQQQQQQQQQTVSQPEPFTAVKVPLMPVAEHESLHDGSEKAKRTSGYWSDTSGDAGLVAGDDWSKSSIAS